MNEDALRLQLISMVLNSYWDADIDTVIEKVKKLERELFHIITASDV